MLRLWEDAEYLQLGEMLCKSIPTSEQPHWFSVLLEMVLVNDEKIGAISSLLEITQDERRWSESREIFDSLREQNLHCERLESHNFRKIGILHLAENIAKVTFNCSGVGSAQFDFDSGYWIPQCIKYIVDHSKDEKLNTKLVEYLVNPELLN